ncbi:MAG: hypothetical protein ACREBD_29740, partial [Blastocatellia bacterium]
AGREEDIIVNATINGESVSSQTGATVAFQERLSEANAAFRGGVGINRTRAISNRRKTPAKYVYRMRVVN